jgi:hypothetical protein
VVDSGNPCHSTVDEDSKPEPVTVSVNPFPPSMPELGLKVMVEPGAGRTANPTGGELVPSELLTVTFTVPGNAIKLAGTKAVNWVGLR